MSPANARYESDRIEPLATESQVKYLVILGIRREDAQRMLRSEAIEQIAQLRQAPSLKQRQYLLRRGFTNPEIDLMTRDDAIEVIGSFKSKQVLYHSNPTLRLVGGS